MEEWSLAPNAIQFASSSILPMLSDDADLTVPRATAARGAVVYALPTTSYCRSSWLYDEQRDAFSRYIMDVHREIQEALPPASAVKVSYYADMLNELEIKQVTTLAITPLVCATLTTPAISSRQSHHSHNRTGHSS